mmetsp:Transcript_19893/g.58721  ORF Transcript_19893/g.58721 Transcript_19893/m.58721 type:complete len:232 (+) Transcript_19893:379-1074(+)
MPTERASTSRPRRPASVPARLANGEGAGDGDGEGDGCAHEHAPASHGEGRAGARGPRPRFGDKAGRLLARPPLILRLECLDELRRLVHLDQRHGATAEAATGHAGAVDALHARGDLHEGVQLLGGDGVVVPQRVVALDHELARSRIVVAAEGLHRVLRARVLGDHVPRALEFEGAHRVLAREELGHRGTPQERRGRGPRRVRKALADGRRRRVALPHAARVLAALELVLHV